MLDKRDVVVITEASGFIGSALIRRLAPRYRVIALDKPGPLAVEQCLNQS